jgi:arginine/lysine/ornithine decarboxylase
VTLTPSATSGAIAITASADVFAAGHVGIRLRLDGKEVIVTAVSSPTQAQATTREALASAAATREWEEQRSRWCAAGRPRRPSTGSHGDRRLARPAEPLWLTKSATFQLRSR